MVRSPVLRGRIKRTFDLPAEMVEAMDAARTKHGTVWAEVVRAAILAELDRLSREPRPDDPK